MQLPFSTEQFFRIFALYNDDVWPAQVFLYALAATAVVLAMRGQERNSRVVAAILTFLWLWMAGVYHLAFFRRINPAAVIFAALFVAEAFLLFWSGVWRSRLRFRIAPDSRTIAGALILAYAIIGYPLIGTAIGQQYPAVPTFGAPCPTTIFTLGLLLWSDPKAMRRLAVIPIVWAFIAMQAAIQMSIGEDWGLTAAAVVILAEMLRDAVKAHHRGLTTAAMVRSE